MFEIMFFFEKCLTKNDTNDKLNESKKGPVV